MALISGITDKVIPDDLIAFGEIGLSGEVRAVSHIEYRVKEAVRLGFTKIVLPKKNVTPSLKVPEGVVSVSMNDIEKEKFPEAMAKIPKENIVIDFNK